MTPAQLAAPFGHYLLQDQLHLDGRLWVVTAVAHTGKEMTIATLDAGKFRRERVQIEDPT